jgi:hypothetical protein
VKLSAFDDRSYPPTEAYLRTTRGRASKDWVSLPELVESAPDRRLAEALIERKMDA